MGTSLDAALADCNEVLKLVPNDPYAHDNIGLIYLKRKQYDKAIAEYNASLKVDPDRARALYGRGLGALAQRPGPGRHRRHVDRKRHPAEHFGRVQEVRRELRTRRLIEAAHDSDL